MNEQDFNEQEFTEDATDGEEIPFADKRRFDAEGARADDDAKTEKTKSPEFTKLENELKDERARRQSAEAKLVGVQTKFNDEKNRLERETQEMRARLTKTLEDRAKQGQFNFLTTLLPVLDN